MISLGRGFSNDWDMSTSKRNFKFSQEVIDVSLNILDHIEVLFSSFISNVPQGFDMARSAPIIHQPTLKIGAVDAILPTPEIKLLS